MSSITSSLNSARAIILEALSLFVLFTLRTSDKFARCNLCLSAELMLNLMSVEFVFARCNLCLSAELIIRVLDGNIWGMPTQNIFNTIYTINTSGEKKFRKNEVPKTKFGPTCFGTSSIYGNVHWLQIF